MKLFLLFIALFLSFTYASYDVYENEDICKEKPWLCENEFCPENEEMVMDFCRCKPGFERDENSLKCEPILK